MTETMSVVTRHSSQNVGTRLLFDQDGRILSQETAPRAVGTDVKLASIFTTMPVRLKEFERNLKREFAKMVKILQVRNIFSSRKYKCIFIQALVSFEILRPTVSAWHLASESHAQMCPEASK